MTYSVTLSNGARYSLLPPGTSWGAKTNPDVYRVALRGQHTKIWATEGLGVMDRRDIDRHKARQRYRKEKAR